MTLSPTCLLIVFVHMFYICCLLQKIRSILRSSAGPLSGSLRRKTATIAQRRSVSMRKKSCASSTPNVAGVSGDTHPPLHLTSPEGAATTIHTPESLTLSRHQDSQLSLGRPVSVSNLCVLVDGRLSGATSPSCFCPPSSGLMPSLWQKAVAHKSLYLIN